MYAISAKKGNKTVFFSRKFRTKASAIKSIRMTKGHPYWSKYRNMRVYKVR